MEKKFIHELHDVEALYRHIGDDKKIDPYLVEKDYWIMHALWGLKNQGYDFELKGGTSLSKGYQIIDRFSEDIDIKIIPNNKKEVPIGKNQNKKIHIVQRQLFFENLTKEITIPGMSAKRDYEYDDPKFRNAGIRLTYKSLFQSVSGIKEGILLEVGFDQTTPNEPIDISSWAYERAEKIVPNLLQNQAKSIKCYFPEYTFVEKLQAITKKARQQQEKGEFHRNFLRHFYDIHELFQQKRVKQFIGTESYKQHKANRFRGADNPILQNNLVFNLDKEDSLFSEYRKEFSEIKRLFMSGTPSFEAIYASIVSIREIG